MQRWRRPNAPRWSAHARAFIPRPWIISTGVPSRAPHSSYAIRTPSLVVISLTGPAYGESRPRLGEQLRHRVAHRFREAGRRERVVGVVGVRQRDERAEPHAPRPDREAERTARRDRDR